MSHVRETRPYTYLSLTDYVLAHPPFCEGWRRADKNQGPRSGVNHPRGGYSLRNVTNDRCLALSPPLSRDICPYKRLANSLRNNAGVGSLHKKSDLTCKQRLILFVVVVIVLVVVLYGWISWRQCVIFIGRVYILRVLLVPVALSLGSLFMSWRTLQKGRQPPTLQRRP